MSKEDELRLIRLIDSLEKRGLNPKEILQVLKQVYTPSK